jgi:hypothetical protein
MAVNTLSNNYQLSIPNRENLFHQQPDGIVIWACHEGIPKEDTVFKNRQTELLSDNATTAVLHNAAITITNI